MRSVIEMDKYKTILGVTVLYWHCIDKVGDCWRNMCINTIRA